MDEWINKRCYVFTVEYCPALKQNEILLYTTTWMNLKDIMPNEISQTQKHKYYMIVLI